MIKGYYQKPQLAKPPTLAGSIDSIIKTKEELDILKKNVAKTADDKIKELDTHIENAETILDKKIQDVDSTIKKAEKTIGETVKEAMDYVKTIEAEPVDENKIVESVLAKIPEPQKIDEKALINKVISKIPENKASLKIIQETFETDPMSVINKILELAKDGKFKLKTENIDGLSQTIQAFRHQIGERGYLHGGGDTVKAGTGIAIANNANGTKTISATGGITGLTSVVLTSGSGTSWNIPTAPNTVISVAGRGQILYPNAVSSGYTYLGTVLTTTDSFASGDILIVYV